MYFLRVMTEFASGGRGFLFSREQVNEVYAYYVLITHLYTHTTSTFSVVLVYLPKGKTTFCP